MTTLSALCPNIYGQMVQARLKDPHLCAGDIANNNGVLECRRNRLSCPRASRCRS